MGFRAFQGAQMTAKADKRYRAKVGIDYLPRGGDHEKHADPGAILQDLPFDAVPAMLACGEIEEVVSKPKRKEG